MKLLSLNLCFLEGFRNEIDWIKSRLSRLGSEREDMDEGALVSFSFFTLMSQAEVPRDFILLEVSNLLLN